MTIHTEFLTKNSSKFVQFVKDVLIGTAPVPSLEDAKKEIGSVDKSNLDKKQAMLFLTLSNVYHKTNAWQPLKEDCQPEGDLTDESLEKWAKEMVKCLNAIRTLSALSGADDYDLRLVFTNPLLVK